jgi:hypothetical protein
METIQLMACGCSAQGVMVDKETGNKIPCCVVHDCTIPAENQPDLTGRKAVCTYSGHRPVDSKFKLAYFVYTPEKETDSYYCGCYGWD